MQWNEDVTGTAPEIDPAASTVPAHIAAEAGENRTTLAGLDVGLFKALRRLGTPKKRICSALWLSYAEYEDLAKMI